MVKRLAALVLGLITVVPAIADDSFRPPVAVGTASVDLPAFGVSLTPPAGWRRDLAPAGNRVARWVKLDDQGKPDAILEVDFARATLPNAQEWQHLTNDLHATALRTVHTDGNLDGAWVKGSFESGGLTASQMFVISRDSTRYTAALIHRMPPTAAVAEADDSLMQDFIAHWKWREVEEPSSHLDLSGKPFTALGGVVNLSAPAIAQMVTVEDARTRMQFQVMNLKSNSSELIVELNLKGTGMPDLPAVGKVVKANLKLEADLQWTGVGSKGSISQWVKSDREEVPYWVMFGAIKVDETHSILLSCTLDRPEASVQRAYWDCVKAVVAGVSVQAGKAVP